MIKKRKEEKKAKEERGMKQSKEREEGSKSVQGTSKGKHEGIAKGFLMKEKSAEKCRACRENGREMKLRRCIACLQVAYCGNACQRNDSVRQKVD